jgi:hypothetical protein
MFNDDDYRPTLMQTTPGTTAKRFTAEPLGTEGEFSAGPDEANPYRSATEREVVEQHQEKERLQRTGDVQLFKTSTGTDDTGGVSHPMHTNSTVNDPTEGSDPFVFDDLGGGFELPGFENINPFNGDGPRF